MRLILHLRRLRSEIANLYPKVMQMVIMETKMKNSCLHNPSITRALPTIPYDSQTPHSFIHLFT